jgi:hypothetical protein
MESTRLRRAQGGKHAPTAQSKHQDCGKRQPLGHPHPHRIGTQSNPHERHPPSPFLREGGLGRGLGRETTHESSVCLPAVLNFPSIVLRLPSKAPLANEGGRGVSPLRTAAVPNVTFIAIDCKNLGGKMRKTPCGPDMPTAVMRACRV